MRTNLHKKQAAKQARNTFFIRLALALVFIGLGATSGVMLHASAMNQGLTSTSEAAAAEEPTKSYVLDEMPILCVEPGDTLWDIAEEYAPEGVSVKAYVKQIMIANSLEQAALEVGQVLRLP
ncbi:LysM peptidoglycan-binding domain-containing protein [Paenibacillus sp.]|uniref:LysM peptidoglycan-binding domain-containing protein n=1 Tax=Paenibacillus sp. TaxID=58172 RepID=UPI002D55BB3B|nr:LysM peptidoglycan-binding domain-containing protein [Paenibacillus sp.]HZG88479.1 LysM peptidoglycan-binding domain-containing protein [Paenibacillus sp.]